MKTGTVLDKRNSCWQDDSVPPDKASSRDALVSL